MYSTTQRISSSSIFINFLFPQSSTNTLTYTHTRGTKSKFIPLKQIRSREDQRWSFLFLEMRERARAPVLALKYTVDDYPHSLIHHVIRDSTHISTIKINMWLFSMKKKKTPLYLSLIIFNYLAIGQEKRIVTHRSQMSYLSEIKYNRYLYTYR